MESACWKKVFLKSITKTCHLKVGVSLYNEAFLNMQHLKAVKKSLCVCGAASEMMR